MVEFYVEDHLQVMFAECIPVSSGGKPFFKKKKKRGNKKNEMKTVPDSAAVWDVKSFRLATSAPTETHTSITIFSFEFSTTAN